MTVHCERGGRTWRGQGISTDIVEASALAYLDAVNRIAARDTAKFAPAAESGAET